MEYIQILILKNNKETINLLDMYCYGSLTTIIIQIWLKKI